MGLNVVQLMGIEIAIEMRWDTGPLSACIEHPNTSAQITESISGECDMNEHKNQGMYKTWQH